MISGHIVETRGVSKTFRLHTAWGRATTITAVDRVTLWLAPGQTLGLVGESGSGKSTLARLLLGLLTPTSGEIRMTGSRQRVQCVFQDPVKSLDPRMTVEEIIGEGLLIHRLARGAALRAQVNALLELVALPAAYRQRVPRQLSGGERQRVAIARVLAVEPECLICDEPIASLDLSIGAQIIELLRRLHQERQMGLLFISHDLGAVAALCDQIAVMHRGRIIERAATSELLARPQHAYTKRLLRSTALDLDADESRA